MPQTYTFTTDAAAPDEAISPREYCSLIVIYENNQAGTADYKIRMPSSTSPQITRPAGAKTEIRSSPGTQFAPGVAVAYISAASGSLTFVQEEY